MIIDFFKTNKIVIIADHAVANDLPLHVNKLLKIADHAVGIDDFLMKGEMLFKDSGIGFEVFTVTYPYPRELKRTIIIIRGIPSGAGNIIPSLSQGGNRLQLQWTSCRWT